MVLTTPMVFTQTDGIVSVLLDHTRTRGPSVARMWDFFCYSVITGGEGEIRVLKCLDLKNIVPKTYFRERF